MKKKTKDKDIKDTDKEKNKKADIKIITKTQEVPKQGESPVNTNVVKLNDLEIKTYRLIKTQYKMLEKVNENLMLKRELLTREELIIEKSKENLGLRKELLNREISTTDESMRGYVTELEEKYSINFENYIMDLANFQLIKKKT